MEAINLISSMDDTWSYFKDSFSIVIDKHAPLKQFQNFKIATLLAWPGWFDLEAAELADGFILTYKGNVVVMLFWGTFEKGR